MDKEKMNIQITSDNMEITESMKVLAHKKIEKIISKISEGTPEDLVDLRIVLNKGDEDGTFGSKLILQLGGFKVVGSGTDYTLESSLVEAVDDTLRRYNKKKSKQNSEEWEKQREMKSFPTE